MPRMRLTGLSWPVALLGLALLASPVRAGRLTIDAAAQARLSRGRLEVRLSLTNRGDQPALRLRAELLGRERPVFSGELARLEPGRTAGLDLADGAPQGPPGHCGLVVRVGFQDPGQDQFSALAWAECFLGRDQPSPLQVRAGPLALAGRGRLRFEIHNPLEAPLRVRASLFSPWELAVPGPVRELSLPGQSGRELAFDLINLSGLAGAEYPVMLLLEHRLGGLHSARVFPVQVSLVERPNLVRDHPAWWLAAALGLAGLLAAAQFRARRRP